MYTAEHIAFEVVTGQYGGVGSLATDSAPSMGVWYDENGKRIENRPKEEFDRAEDRIAALEHFVLNKESSAP